MSNAPNNPDTLSESEARCHEFLAAYQKTGNPLYAWFALREWLHPQFAPEPGAFGMPRLLARFLHENTASVTELALAVALGKIEKNSKLSDEKKDKKKKRITSQRAITILPAALKLKAYGCSAFDEFAREVSAEHWQTYKTAFRAGGASEKEAVEQLAKWMGLKDEREARRRLKGGRRPPKKPSIDSGKQPD